MQKKYDVIVIGAGITGAGIARDLSMRGATVLLVDRSDIATGATGRSHGLLHSGARYAVKDPESARECAQENLILKRIASHIIEDTGGFFVSTLEDPNDYVDKFVKSCKNTGVYIEENTLEEIRKAEPNLSRSLKAGFYVNDGSVDPFKLTLLNVLDAIDMGATVKTYNEVIGFLMQEESVIGVKVHDILNNIINEYYADIIVNATGAWAGKIGSYAGITIPANPSKGSLIIFARRIFNHVINRLRPPSDGDIFVPSYGTTILGTTSVSVEDPDDFTPSMAEIAKIFNEGLKVYPDLLEVRPIRSYAGPRPLIEGTGREAKRTFTIFDHSETDGIDGLITIGGGKLTTYRLMAEKVSDLVSEKLGLSKTCGTHRKPLPGFYDGREIQKLVKKSRLFHSYVMKAVERWGLITRDFILSADSIVCLCEGTTYSEIEYSIKNTLAKTIGDVMRRTRSTMGPCQGQNCFFKVSGILFDILKDYERIAVEDICSHLRKRWRNIKPVAFNGLLDQSMLASAIYNLLGNLNYKVSEND